MIVSYSKVPESTKSAHQAVELDDVPAGEVWREQVTVDTGKGTRGLRWRWFAKTVEDSTTIGRNTRTAAFSGAGFVSKDKAFDAMVAKRAAAADVASPQVERPRGG